MTQDIDLVRQERRRLLATADGRPRWGWQCTRVKRNGDRCGNWAIRGATVCRKHGGQLPAVQAAAKRRLALLAIDAVYTLGDLLKDTSDDRIRLRTARAVLAYNGITPRAMQGATGGRPPALAAAGAPEVGTSATLDEDIAMMLSAIDEAEQRALQAGVETDTPTTDT